MIISKIKGGLGNQMFQYAVAKSIAKHNNTEFKLDISFYPKQSLRNYELNLFNIEENIATNKESNMLGGKEGFLFKVKKKLGFNNKKPKTYCKEDEVKPVFNESLFECSDKYLDGYWADEKYFKNIRTDIINDFTPKNDISADAQNYLKDISETNSISLHVRRGDYVQNSHTNSFHGTCSIQYYIKAIEYIKEKIEKPTFFIFSDDIVWCKENFDFLDNKVFVDKTHTSIDDLTLMKKCKHNIVANSTFSWWGAWLNENESKIVIAPQVWLISQPEINIACSSWIKL